MPKRHIMKFMIREVKTFMKILEKSIRDSFQTLISSLADFRASHSQLQGKENLLQITEGICSSNLPESLKPKDLSIFYLKMFPDFLVLKRGQPTQKSLTRFANWGIAWHGVCLTALISACHNQG